MKYFLKGLLKIPIVIIWGIGCIPMLLILAIVLLGSNGEYDGGAREYISFGSRIINF